MATAYSPTGTSNSTISEEPDVGTLMFFQYLLKAGKSSPALYIPT